MASNSFGELLRLTTFGESHGPSIGGVLDGFPPGIFIDTAFIQKEMERRKPGQSDLTTPRAETDEVHILSGVFENITTGAPIAFLIHNRDQRSEDYTALQHIYRPGHADEVYDLKYGLRDYRGGGRSSARETAVRVAAGAFCKMLLQKENLILFSYVHSIGDIHITTPPMEVDLIQIETNAVRCPDQAKASEMIKQIELAKANKDSLGGQIMTVIKNVPIGLGDPIYQKLNARLAFAMMSINAVQGFEMHRGFERTSWNGSENNLFETGISAGISNGKPIVFNVAFKPTSTIAQLQKAKNTEGQNVTLEAAGRHDPCVLPRAVPIVEAMTALVLADAMLMSKSQRI
jgi:chorismate synthase